jgi:hypothetical protein
MKRNIPQIKSTLALLGTLFCAASALAQGTLWTNLVSYWPLDTTNANTTPDLAIGNTFGVSNAPALSSSTHNGLGMCLQFSGSGQDLNIVHTTDSRATGLPIYSTNGYTIAMWVQGASQAANHIFFTEGGYNGGAALLFDFNTAANGKMRVLVKNNAGTTVVNNLSSITTVFDGNWHHVAWVDVNGAAKLYIDGNFDTNFNYTAQGGPSANITSVAALVRSANPTGTDFFAGSVDEIMLWSRALSQIEIQTIITNGLQTPIPPVPPTWTAQPASTTNSMGDRVILTGIAFGNQPMAYQWFSNNVAVTGQTNNTLLLTSLTSPGTNAFFVVATNIAGTNTSAVANVVVLPDAAPNISSGLVSYWPFDVVSNSAYSPDLISQNNMQLANMTGANLVPGEFSNALSFDGATQYGSETTGTPIYDLSTTYTVAFWVNGAPDQSSYRIMFANATNNGQYFLIGNDPGGASGRIDVRISPPMADTLSAGTALDTTWHHIAWVDQDGNGLLYIDGVLDRTIYSYTRGTLNFNNTTVAALLDTGSPQYYFAGDIDDLGTWNRRLSYTEIQSIIANGIPAPPTYVKPSLVLSTQPAELTNDVYQGDTVSFTVTASGTTPFSYQWRSNGVPISAASNPTAITNTLVLANVQPSFAGPYTVVVTNLGGATTSSVVQLDVIPYVPTTNGLALQVEFNQAALPIVQPGFSSMTLNGNPATFNGPRITLSPIGATSLSDRDRTVPVNNPPNFTTADLYDQFIFSTASTAGSGIDILIQRLAPNTLYGLTLWSYDQENTVASDWDETSSGTPVTIQDDYAFTGSQQPTLDYQYTLGTNLVSTADGELEIQGVAVSGTSGVFLNALRLVANPVIVVTSVSIYVGQDLQIVAQAQYPNQVLQWQESADLTLGEAGWAPATDLINQTYTGPIVTALFPISSTQLFYRAVFPGP